MLNQPVGFHARFYAHVILLHAALLLRVSGDLADWLPGRQWGAIGNGAAILLFLLNTAGAVLFPPKPR